MQYAALGGKQQGQCLLLVPVAPAAAESCTGCCAVLCFRAGTADVLRSSSTGSNWLAAAWPVAYAAGAGLLNERCNGCCCCVLALRGVVDDAACTHVCVCSCSVCALPLCVCSALERTCAVLGRQQAKCRCVLFKSGQCVVVPLGRSMPCLCWYT